MGSSAEALPWYLPYTVYAVLTGILAPLFWKIIGHLADRRRRLRLKEKEQITKEIANFEKTQDSLGWTISELRGDFENTFTGWKPWHVFIEVGDTELKEKLTIFRENIQECEDWCYSSILSLDRIIDNAIGSRLVNTLRYSRDKFPNEPFFIRKLILENDMLKHRHLLHGTDFDETFMKKMFPETLGKIKDILQPPDEKTSLDLFFREANAGLRSDRILTRYRKERDECIKQGEKLYKEIEIRLMRLKHDYESL